MLVDACFSVNQKVYDWRFKIEVKNWNIICCKLLLISVHLDITCTCIANDCPCSYFVYFSFWFRKLTTLHTCLHLTYFLTSPKTRRMLHTKSKNFILLVSNYASLLTWTSPCTVHGCIYMFIYFDAKILHLALLLNSIPYS